MPNGPAANNIALTPSPLSRDEVDEILARAGMLRRVETSARSALTEQLQPVDFPAGHTVYADGESGDRLYIIISGKVKIGRRS
jgi:CRP/FNR family cyclic AMP-dependent transcriptional regulator